MRDYLRIFFFTQLAFTIILGAPILYLYQVGEYTSPSDISRKQLTNNEVIYGSGLHDESRYKLEALEIRKPEIIALGSSRVMQFRQKYFNRSFYNLGGLMSSIREGHMAFEYLKKAKPKLVVIGIDTWWFNSKFKAPETYQGQTIDTLKNKPQPSDLIKFTEYLIEGKIKNYSNQHIGLAGKRGDGFGNDGFRHYDSSLTGETKHHDINFQDTFSRIERGNSRFEYGSSADPEHVKNFIDLVQKIERNGIEVIIFFPPFAKAVNDKIDKLGSSYGYMDDIKTQLRNHNIHYYDYARAEIYHSNDCEFIDGFHGGEITYARILLEISKLNDRIFSIINLDAIEKSISSSSGMASSDAELSNNKKEIDFLNIGCKKNHH